ncbi:Exocyst complex component S5 [Ceratocystis pirilliformis]|uniref:Exocyst complex component SEC5 n=1 Tax=Ceratocystis pirilliformis TaxID=259994 RepID=A0ABR3ZJX2_9PEZI
MDQRKILEFYHLSTPFPIEWPAENSSDESEDEELKAKSQRRKSRYQALEKARKSMMPKGRSSNNSSAVHMDEPDPLGTSDSVVRSLRQMGIRIEDRPQLRNQFMLSSTTFSPAVFLSQIHGQDDTRSLITGLDNLSQSIDQKSASLKVLVESNFERFVKAKATIDNVYREMKYRGADQELLATRSQQQTLHARRASRNSFRNSVLSPNTLPSTLIPEEKKKNALLKESEYGVMGIKAPLLEVSAKAEDVWGPALGGQEKENSLKLLMNNFERYKEYTELGSSIADSIKRKDLESLVEDYNKARQFVEDSRNLAKQAAAKELNLSDGQIYQLLIAGRMWNDVEDQIQIFKRSIWRKLTSTHQVARSEGRAGQSQDQYMEYITLLLELGVDQNPIYMWLASEWEFLKGRIQTTADRCKVEIEVLRRRLANRDRPNPHVMASHLRSLGRQIIESKPSQYDTTDVIELWEKMQAFLSSLLSSQGILGEIVEFERTLRGFVDGTTQRTLPIGFQGESVQHHKLTSDGTETLEKGVVELVDALRDHVFSFFAGLPPEDISLLFSPLPPSPSPAGSNMNGPMTPRSGRDMRFNLDPLNVPPTTKRGEAWEKFAFWPPWSNSISGVHYLSNMLALVGSGAADLAGLRPVKAIDPTVVDRLRNLVGVARERCVTALCPAWNTDAENVKFVEDWHRSVDQGDVTKMPASFAAFEGTMLAGMQKILYISEAMSKSEAGDIVLPPPAKLQQMVRSQYVTTLYKALSGMVENAERSIKTTGDDWTTEFDRSTLSSSIPVSVPGGRKPLDAGDRNVRMLLTLSNLQALRSQVVPSLNSQFENAFSVKLTDESKTIKDVLGQIDARLFQSYTRPAIENLRAIIKAGISSSSWVPRHGVRPTEARPYVYEALLSLVLIHSQVSTTTPSLTNQILSFLLEQLTQEMLEVFKVRDRYPLEALMQATLDVEFVSQTLSQYTSPKAGDMQGVIYQELDSRTDNDARARLQSELPEMRNTLKKLREASKNEFGCFRKPKRPAMPGLERRDTDSSVTGY